LKKRHLFFLLFTLLLIPSLNAKEKEYQDGTLLSMERWHPGAMVALNAAVSGYNIKPAWLFRIQVGDWTYGASVEKRFGKLDEAEWPANAAVKIRFDIKGGGIATRTKMYIQRADGKELESDILTITDKNGKNDYCGTRKCDPVSAVKKYEKEHGQ
jgi:hypothetical protein